MKLLVDILKEDVSDEDLLEAIKMARIEGSMGGPTANITVLDDPEYDLVLKEWYDAGLHLIGMATCMYDGSIQDTEDCIHDMTKQEAIERVDEGKAICGTLAQAINEIGFDRALIYQQHDEW